MFGFLGIGVVFDMVRLFYLVYEVNNCLWNLRFVENEDKWLDDVYLFWFVFGLFGKKMFIKDVYDRYFLKCVYKFLY